MHSTLKVMRRSLFTAAALAVVFVACKSNNIAATNNNFLSQTIGASGGSFKDPTNFEEITVPAGSLAADTALQIGVLADGAYPALPSAVTKQGPVFAFKPYSTTFTSSATVFIPVPSGQSGLVVYRAPTDTSATTDWATVTASAINKNDAAGQPRDFMQVPTNGLGVYTLAPLKCTGGQLACGSSCIAQSPTTACGACNTPCGAKVTCCCVPTDPNAPGSSATCAATGSSVCPTGFQCALAP